MISAIHSAMRRLGASSLLALLVALWGGPAATQMAGFCGDHTKMVKKLKLGYGETRLGIGQVSPQALIEIWASEKTRTWTILEVYPGGMACIQSSGTRWMTYEPEVKGQKT